MQGLDPDRRISGYLLISDLLGSILPYQIALGHYLVLSGLDRATIRTYSEISGSKPHLPRQWVGTTCRGPTGGRVLEGVIKLPLSPPQARKFWRY